MNARLPRLVVTLMALSGFALLGSSVQSVAGMDDQLRSSVRSLPVQEGRDCPFEGGRHRAREV